MSNTSINELQLFFFFINGHTHTHKKIKLMWLLRLSTERRCAFDIVKGAKKEK